MSDSKTQSGDATPINSLTPEKTALIWLHIGQRPWRARELWLMAEIFSSVDLARWDKLFDQSKHVSDQAALLFVQNWLGGLITTRHDDNDANIIYVELSDSDMRRAIAYHQEHPGSPEPKTLLSGPMADGHAFAVLIMMLLVSLTTINGNEFQLEEDGAALSVILYSWTHWSTHLKLSGKNLNDPNNEPWCETVDGMVKDTCISTLAFLLDVNDFVTEPITLPVIQDQARCNALVREVQEALEGPILLLSSLIKTRDIAKELQACREIVRLPRANFPKRRDIIKNVASDAESQLNEGDLYRSLGMEDFVINTYLAHTLPLFDKEAAQKIRQLIDAARGLRALCVAIVKSPIYEELVSRYGENVSAVDILAKQAALLEAVGTYPYWDEIPLSSTKFRVNGSPIGGANKATKHPDPNAEAVRVVNALIRNDGDRYRPIGSAPVLSAEASMPLLTSFSPMRYRAARLVYKIRGLPHASSLGTKFTINPFSPPHLGRVSSFSAVPETLSSSSGLISLLPRRFYTKLVPGLNRTVARISPLFESVGQVSSAVFTMGQADRWPYLKRSIMSKGFRTAAVYVGVAIVLHHLRTMLAPWLGAYFWNTPLEHLRLALARPDVFVHAVLQTGWVWLAFSWTQKFLWDFVAIILSGIVAHHQSVRELDGQTELTMTYKTEQEAAMAKMTMDNLATEKGRLVLDGLRVFHLTWMFTGVEFVFAKGIFASAWIVGFGKLLMGGDAEHVAMGAALRDHKLKSLLVFYLVWEGFKTAVLPWFVLAFVGIFQGQLGMLIVVSGVIASIWAILAHRSTFYMALQLSGMFVAGGFLVLTLVMLAGEFWDDPLGVKMSTALARKKGLRARTVLPQDSIEKVQSSLKKGGGKSAPSIASGPPPPPPPVNRGVGASAPGLKKD